MVFGAGQLRFGHLADVAEQVRRHRGRILPGRHVLVNDAGQLGLAGRNREPLLARRVLDQDDRPVARLAAPAVHGLVHQRLVSAGRQRQRVQCLIEVLRLFADQRDVERAAVLDEDLAVAIEQHAAWRGQRQPPKMIFLGHLPELLVLHDLEHPERHCQRREEDGDDVLERRQPHRQAAAVLRHHHRCCRHIRRGPVASSQLPVASSQVEEDSSGPGLETGYW